MSDVDARIDSAAAALGVEVFPWQREWLRAVLSGERVVVSRGRRGGWTTAGRIAEHAARAEEMEDSGE